MTDFDVVDLSEPMGPFEDQSETLAVIAITLMRIYDVELARLTLLDEALADKVNEAHAAGQVVASLPYLDIGPSASSENPQEDTA